LLERRLTKLEASLAPAHGYVHVIYARDLVDFEGQKADLITSGMAAASDTFMDWNSGLPVDEHEAAEPESFPITHSHEEWVDILAREERTQ
jgi:hypothetical protein